MIDRFFRYVGKKTEGGCIPWTGPCNKKGRGVLDKGGASKGQALAYRIAYEFACGPIPEGLCVCHRCDNPSCVNPTHLFLGTRADNAADRDAKGRQARGEKNSFVVLTEGQVLAIRKRLAEGARQKPLALEFGVTQQTVSLIARGKMWRHLLGSS